MDGPRPAEPEPTEPVEVLAGGIANAGQVLRIGTEVHRPASAHSPTILALLRHLHETGFDGASVPLGVIDGRERLVYLPGDVAVPPYPPWAQTDSALASVARLLRRLHTASASFRADPHATWSTEMADLEISPQDRLTVCHNDVCLENVVFRDGEARGLLDFDFAAPGRPLYDLAQLARLCIPLDPDPVGLGWHPGCVDPAGADAPARLAVVAQAYGVRGHERADLLDLVAAGIARGGQFLQRQVERGDPNFVALWQSLGGSERFDRRRAWWARTAPTFRRALGLRAYD